MGPTPSKYAKLLLEQIQGLVDGNQVERSDVCFIKEKTGTISLELTLNWEFVCNSSSTTESGNISVGKSFSNSVEHNQYLRNLKSSAITNKKFRSHFVNKITNDKNRALLFSDQVRRVYKFDSISYTQTCTGCGGRGKIQCTSCYGSCNSICSGCSGSGHSIHMSQKTEYKTDFFTGQRTVHYYTEEQKITCSLCGGIGKRQCDSCGGSGQQKCKTCSGAGCHTTITQSWLDAVPKQTLKVGTEFRSKECYSFFSRLTAGYFYNKFPLNYKTHSYSQGSCESFQYSGAGPLIEMWFKIKEIEHVVLGHSENMLAFYKPPLFDFLFQDEIKELQSLFDEKQKLNRKKAFGLFRHYTNQPVLNKALKNIARDSKNKHKNETQTVINVCQGYITKEKANLLGKAVLGLLNKLSPQLSVFTWVLLGLIFIIIAMLVVIYAVETHWVKSFGASLKFVLSAFIGLVILSVIPATISYISSWIKSKKVPVEYRQKILTLFPLKKYLKISILMLGVGLAYGYLSKNKALPKIGTLSLEALNIRQFVDFRVYGQRKSTIKIYATLNPSDKDKILYIQNHLKKMGFNIVADGVMGPQTYNSLKKYFKELKKTIPNSGEVVKIFEEIVLIENLFE